MATTLAGNVHSRCLAWLNDGFTGVHVGDNGWIVVPGVGSTIVVVDVSELGHRVKVNVLAPLLIDVPVTDDLLRFLAREGSGYHFGTVSLEEVGQDLGVLTFEYPLIGDALDKVELETACALVGGTADELDNKLQARFGGRLFCS